MDKNISVFSFFNENVLVKIYVVLLWHCILFIHYFPTLFIRLTILRLTALVKLVGGLLYILFCLLCYLFFTDVFFYDFVLSCLDYRSNQCIFLETPLSSEWVFANEWASSLQGWRIKVQLKIIFSVQVPHDECHTVRECGSLERYSTEEQDTV